MTVWERVLRAVSRVLGIDPPDEDFLADPYGPFERSKRPQSPGTKQPPGGA